MEKQNFVKLYICDGSACSGAENCYLKGGNCMHTSQANHSLKRISGSEFPETTFVKVNNCLVEKIVMDGEVADNFAKVVDRQV